MKINFGIRLHFGLYMLSQEVERRYAGIGMSINDIGGECILSSGDSTVSINDKKDEELTIFFNNLLLKFSISNSKIEIKLNFPRHCGFGTGTQIRLAIIKVLNEYYSLNINSSDFLELSGRGGASGIGLKAFETEGLIFDLGRKLINKQEDFLPTSFHKSANRHIYLQNLKISWSILVGIPKTNGYIKGASEKRLFSNICPMDYSFDLQASFITYSQIYTSAIEGDLISFTNGITNYQNLEWKNFVKNQLKDEFKNEIEFIEQLLDLKFFISSWGPGIFAYVENDFCYNINNLNGKLNHYKVIKI